MPEQIHHECTRALVEIIEALSNGDGATAQEAYQVFADNVEGGEEPELVEDIVAWSRVKEACSPNGQ